MTHIKEVTPREDYQLEVTLDNGSTIILNLKPKLDTLRFGLLRDAAFFERAETDSKVIIWDDKVELSASEIFELVKK